MAMNFDDTVIVRTNESQRRGEWDMKANYENNKPYGEVKRMHKVSAAEYNSNLKRSCLEYKCHNLDVDSMKYPCKDTKLVVSNLHERVNESDIEMLFGEFESYKYCKIHYDDDGWPLGSSDVTFDNKEDAVEAMEFYNGLKLDGHVLNIQLIVSEDPGSPSGSELSSVNDFEMSDSFFEQQALGQKVDALFDEFVRSEFVNRPFRY